jgi:hypothetical protein
MVKEVSSSRNIFYGMKGDLERLRKGVLEKRLDASEL